jgi:restriction system protein
VAPLDRPLVGGRYLVQCKRYASDAGVPAVREFYGTLVADRGALKALFITTSGFTTQAREFAKTLPIELIDGPTLRALLEEVGGRPEAPPVHPTPVT